MSSTRPASAEKPAEPESPVKSVYNDAFKRGLKVSFFSVFVVLAIEGVWLLLGTRSTGALDLPETLLSITMAIGATSLLGFGLALLENLGFLGLVFLDGKVERPVFKAAATAFGPAATLAPAALLASSFIPFLPTELVGLGVPAMAFGALTFLFGRRARRGLSTVKHPLALLATSMVSTLLVFSLISAHLILERIHSHHHADLALKYYLLLMVACPALAYSLYRVALMRLFPSTPSRRKSRRPLAAAALVATLLTTAGIYIFDSIYLPGQYPEFHTFLKLFAYVSGQAVLIASALFSSTLDLPSRLRRLSAHSAFKYGVAVFLAASTIITLVIFESQSTVASFLLSRTNVVAKAISIERSILDFDMDGHSGLLGGGDCDDLDPKINPGTREIVANGIDDNCFGGDLSQEDAVKHFQVYRARQDRDHAWWSAHPSNRKKPYNVLLITIDALRADHCGFMGYDRDTTPRLDRLAEESWVFKNTYCQGGWTSISLPTLLKGLLPYEIAYTNVYEDNYLRLWFPHELHPGIRPLRMFTVPAFDEHESVAQLLKPRGYRTLALLNDGVTDYFQEKFGYIKGFDVYYHNNTEEVRSNPALKGLRSTAKEITAKALEELEALPEDEPFFMWVHHFDPHSPYYSTEFNVWGEGSMEYYDGEVAMADHYVGVLIDKLVEQSRLEDTIVVVTADHGEAFGEHGTRTHGGSGYQEEIKVPLIIRVPKAAPKTVVENVGLVDIVPTIMNLLGLETKTTFSGRSVLPLVYGGNREEPREVLSMTWRYALNGVRESSIKTLVMGRHKIIFNEVGFFWELYDVKSDPLEKNNIAGDDPETFEALKSALMQHVERDHEGLVEMAR